MAATLTMANEAKADSIPIIPVTPFYRCLFVFLRDQQNKQAAAECKGHWKWSKHIDQWI